MGSKTHNNERTSDEAHHQHKVHPSFESALGENVGPSGVFESEDNPKNRNPHNHYHQADPLGERVPEHPGPATSQEDRGQTQDAKHLHRQYNPLGDWVKRKRSKSLFRVHFCFSPFLMIFL